MNSLTVVGNLTDDPQLRFSPSGAPVANFTIAQTPRRFDKATNSWVNAKEANFFRANVWKQQAENVAESLRKGTRVIAVGKLHTEKYERNGETVTSTNNFDVEHIGPSLAYATAVITRNPMGDGGSYRGGENEGGSGEYSNGGGYGNGSVSNDPPF